MCLIVIISILFSILVSFMIVTYETVYIGINGHSLIINSEPVIEANKTIIDGIFSTVTIKYPTDTMLSMDYNGVPKILPCIILFVVISVIAFGIGYLIYRVQIKYI